MMIEQIESKLDIGLDRTLNAVIGWVKLYLQNEQKKTDYNKPDSDFDTLSSAVSFKNHILQKKKKKLYVDTYIYTNISYLFI